MSFVLLAAFAHGAPEHGPAWLNDHGTQTIKWLEERNSQTLTQWRADPRFATFESAAADILTDPGRLSPVTFMGDHVSQYWQTRDSPLARALELVNHLPEAERPHAEPQPDALAARAADYGLINVQVRDLRVPTSVCE